MKITIAEPAVLSDIPVGMVSKVIIGENRKPTYITIEKIERVLAREEMKVRVKAYM